MKYLTCGASMLAVLVAAPTLAEGTKAGESAQAGRSGEVQVLTDRNYDQLYAEGWSVEEMFDETTVTGPDGEEIGDVENLIFADDGKLLAVIAEVGGLWDIGDTHISVPWDQVTLSDDASELQIPVTEDTVADYPVFGEPEATVGEEEGETVAQVEEEVGTTSNAFTATELIGDQAYLNADLRYGYVSDVVVRDGAIAAVVVDAATYGRPGYYAYPYYNWKSPEAGRYDLPYGEADIETIENFDYDRLQAPQG